MPVNNQSVSLTVGAILGSSFGSVIGTSVRQVKGLGAAVRQTNAEMGRIQGLKKLETGVGRTRERLARAKREVDFFTESIAKAGPEGAALFGKDLEAARGWVLKLNVSLGEQQRKLDEHRRSARESGIAVDRLEEQERGLGAALDNLRAKYDRLQDSMAEREANLAKRSALRGQMMDAVVLGVALGGPVKAAMDFESAMADVKKVVNFETPQQFRAIGKDILVMSDAMPMASSQISAIVAAVGQSSIVREELKGFAGNAIKMGAAFDLTGEQSGGDDGQLAGGDGPHPAPCGGPRRCGNLFISTSSRKNRISQSASPMPNLLCRFEGKLR
uniref:Phage tail tape measure protein, TP901 family, core region n=1 Tax=Candidatus Kentrum sp. TC TaxID=2126339 RepID=A0A450ZEX5_9GAMM|nr:MAG: phage tail tape measure protein, TP901 family, core region [Candidatus Kentron sp. TC]